MVALVYYVYFFTMVKMWFWRNWIYISKHTGSKLMLRSLPGAGRFSKKDFQKSKE